MSSRKTPADTKPVEGSAEKDKWRTKNGDVRRTKTRNKLLFAAARVISEFGEGRARIEDFIATAGVSRGTFYNYYTTREELLGDLWAHFGTEPFHHIQVVSEKIDDPVERFATEARLILSGAVKDPIWGWLVYSLSELSQVPKDLLSFPLPDLLLGHRIGNFSFSNMDAALDLVIATLRRAIRGMLEDKRGDDYASDIVEMLLRALGLPDEQARVIANRPLTDIPDWTCAGFAAV